MPGYAIAYLAEVDLNDEVGEYLRRIDDTLPRHGAGSWCTAPCPRSSRAP
jgi:hypothetical protein